MQDNKEKSKKELDSILEKTFESESVKESLAKIAVLYNESPYVRIGEALKGFIDNNSEFYLSLQNTINEGRIESEKKRKKIFSEYRIARNFYIENHLFNYSEEEFAIEIMEFIYDNDIPYKNANEDGIIVIINKFYEFQKERRKPKVANTLDVNKKKKKEDYTSLKLSDLFEETSKYVLIINLLSSKGYIDENTLVWKDNGSGHKTMVGSIFKDLRIKGYFKSKYLKMNSRNYHSVIENTFSLGISKSLIEKSKPNLDWIPFSSQIE